MENAPSVSASELLGGNPPEKKQRPPWPSGVPLVESYPGSGLYRHPVDKAFIKRDDAIARGAPAPTAQPPTSAPAPTPTPTPQPQPEPKPEPQQTGPAPDFSDLPKSESEAQPGNGQPEQEQPTEAELLTAYEQMGAMFWDSMIRLMAAIFGDFWLPKTADERKMVLDALTGWMKSVAFAAFTPIQNLWMAIGLYAMPRMPKPSRKFFHGGRRGKIKSANRNRKADKSETGNSLTWTLTPKSCGGQRYERRSR